MGPNCFWSVVHVPRSLFHYNTEHCFDKQHCSYCFVKML